MAVEMTPELGKKIFPFTPFYNIEKYLPDVIAAANACAAGRMFFIVALATIRAETESFVPCSEEQSRFNTSAGGKPFDLYDFRRELGNQGPPDGERYKGRGYIQLTGRGNYETSGNAVGLDLIAHPDLAAVSQPAAHILFEFLLKRKDKLMHAVEAGDLSSARRIVNGGFHGLARFREAFTIANSILPRD